MSTLRPIISERYAMPTSAPTVGPMPDLRWVPIEQLVVDPTYQREIRGEGRRNVAKIAAEFRWSSFAPVIVAPIDGDRFAIIDGQHRSTAAASLGLQSVPCLVISATRAEQARAFRAINGTVTKISRQALHAASLAAGEPAALALDDLCQRAGVELLRYPVQTEQQKPGQTMAIGCIDKCLRIYGRDILVTALQCATETVNKDTPGLLMSPVIRGLCEYLKAHPDICESGERLLKAFDLIDIAQQHEAAHLMPKPKGTTTANMIARRLETAVPKALALFDQGRCA